MAVVSTGEALAGTPVTLYVDGANGTNTTGCTSSGSGACQTIQEGITAAEALANSDVTLQVAGQGGFFGQQTYQELGGDAIDVPDSMENTDTLRIQGVENPIVTTNGTGSVFTVNGSTGMSGAPRVILDGLTIQHGGGTGTGAGLLVNGDLVLLSDDTIANNTSLGNGGAIYNQSFNTLLLTNDTIANNTAPEGGGAIETLTGNTVLNDDTLYNNTAPGIEIDTQGTARISNSILDATGCNLSLGAMAGIDGGHNVESDNSCNLNASNGDVLNSSTIDLSPLAANGSGGPQTYAISSSSSAFEIVPNEVCGAVQTDERGLARPGIPGQNCDAGAFELQGSPPSPPFVDATSASNLGATTATVSANVTPGGADTHATATCTGGPFTASTVDAGAGSQAVAASVNLTGLTPNTQYSCAVQVSNSVGNATSASPATFTTTAAPPQAPPTVGSTSGSATGSSTATLSGSVNPNGGDTTVSATCSGGPYVASSLDVGSGTTGASSTVNLTGLSPDTQYSCGISATNSGGTATSAARATFTTPPAPPSPPSGATTSASGSSSSPTGTATASISGLSVTATGVGAVTIAQYGSAPVSAPTSFQGSGLYFDIHIAPGSSFTSMTIVFSNLGGATSISWWNGSSWVKVSPQTYSSRRGTITVTLSSTSTPTLSQLTGTVFTGKRPRQSLAKALARCHRMHNRKRRAACIRRAKKRFRHH